jgi:tetratricopeptide (TPR) repeat protein
MDVEQQSAHYLDLARQMLDEAFGDERQQWIRRIVSELPQIRRVFAWLKEQSDIEQGLELAYYLQELWFEAQYTEEGFRIIQDFLAMGPPQESSVIRAMCLDLAGGLAINLNKLELAHSLKKQAITNFRKLGNQRQLGYALLHYGHLLGHAQGLYHEADRIYSDALDLFISLADLGGIAHATGNLASVKLELGDYATAQEFVNDSLKRYSDLDSQWDLALTLGTAAGVAVAQGRFEDAVLLAAASSAHRERIGITLPDAFKNRFQHIEEQALRSLEEEQRSVLWARGKSMTMVEAINYALGNNNISS